jgi:hypothetical protein
MTRSRKPCPQCGGFDFERWVIGPRGATKTCTFYTAGRDNIAALCGDVLCLTVNPYAMCQTVCVCDFCGAEMTL